MKSPSINISKIDAAQRQLETAIVLYFSNGDPISIHTLSAASHQIIQDLCKPKGIKSAIKDLGVGKYKNKKEYIEWVNNAKNFFKHADKDPDPDKHCEFIPTMNDFLIFDACRMYQELTAKVPKLMHIFSLWFYLNEPNIIRDDAQAEKKLLESCRGSFDLQNRADFFQKISEVLIT